MEREVGGGIGMGNTCKPMAVSFQCMTKSSTNKKKIKKKKKKKRKISAPSAKNRGTGKTSALRGTLGGERPRERESPLELEFYMQGKAVTGGVKARHPSLSPG